MYFLLFLVAVFVLYVKSFKDDFTKENIEKVAPVVILIAVIVIISSILSSILKI